MKSKTIKLVLRRVLDDWVNSGPFYGVEGDKLVELIKRDAFVAGGSIVSLLLNERANDFDIYFRTLETAQAVATYFVDRFKEQIKEKLNDMNGELSVVVLDGMTPEAAKRIKIMVKSAGVASVKQDATYEYFEMNPDENAATEFVDKVMGRKGVGDFNRTIFDTHTNADNGPDYEPIFMSTNAISLNGGPQLVFCSYGNPADVVSRFDFTHCTCYYDWAANELVLPSKALECVLNKELLYQGSEYPVCSLLRARKYMKRGWSMTAGQMFKIAWHVNELNLKDYAVLRDQLTGMDAAYFHQLIQLLKEKDPNKVDVSYLMKVIDEIF